MKKVTTLLGLLGVVSLFSACTTDTVSAPDDGEALNSSSSVSSSSESEISSEAQKILSSSSVKTDTVHQEVVISSAGSHSTPYYSSGVFCWTTECEEANANSSASESSSSVAVQSSSAVIEITTSASASAEPPTVTEDQMTDNRDGKTYKLQRIGTVHWMAENLNYSTKTGSFCTNPSTKADLCATHGTFYLYSTATKACPTGWRLPTADEAEAAGSEVDLTWWPIDGRFKVSNGEATEYGLEDEQGYIWIQDNETYNSWRIENYSDKQVTELQSGSATERAYNVRCVSTEM